MTLIDGIPTTHVTRTLLDLAAVVTGAELLVAFDDGVRRGLTSWGRLAAELERFGNRRLGSRTVRSVLAQRTPEAPVPESVLETIFESLLTEVHLPRPVHQHVILDNSGRFVARVDFAYPSHRLAIEIDSAAHHAGTADWRADLARQNRIVALGWRILRFTASDLEHGPHEVRLALSDALHPGRASHSLE